MKVTEPTLIIDERQTKANISKMAQKANDNNLEFRPHFKTHQSKQISDWFKEVGTTSITVSSLGMAKYFADAGWREITVAFPCNILQIELINELASKINLILLVDNESVVNHLKAHLLHSVEIYIEIDTGTHRTGVFWKDEKTIDYIISICKGSEKMSIKGFYSHSGRSYNSRGKEEILKVYQESIDILGHLKQKFAQSIDSLSICYGDTPTCSLVERFEHIDAISPGNFTFYDIMQQQIGSCSYNQISVVMACPVVSINEQRGEVCIYGGAIHFSKDFILEEGKKVFGKMVDLDGIQWSEPIKDCYIKSLSQEHGLVAMNKERIKKLKAGSLLYFLPVHSCLTAECMK
ncbi:MAG: alanine racemase, partial [Bacteroidota bacterium]